MGSRVNSCRAAWRSCTVMGVASDFMRHNLLSGNLLRQKVEHHWRFAAWEAWVHGGTSDVDLARGICLVLYHALLYHALFHMAKT